MPGPGPYGNKRPKYPQAKPDAWDDRMEKKRRAAKIAGKIGRRPMPKIKKLKWRG